jgi:septum formation protein
VLESPDMKPGDEADIQLYLASNSPRRKELLSLVGLKYSTLPTWVDETPQHGEDGIEYVMRLALSKASAAANFMRNDGLILAADTSVVNRGKSGKAEILGKPGDQSEAIEILRGLRGHSHQVFTAISIIRNTDGTILSDLCATDVPMRDYTDEEIEIYVASGDPMDKAGAYAIQHQGFHPVKELHGCYANVMGLPLCHLTRNLRKLGLPPSVNVPERCQAALDYECSVFKQFLHEQA